MANRTIGILGLGIFGQSVLKTLQDQDVDIIAIDDHADVINQYESMITTGIVGDITEMTIIVSVAVVKYGLPSAKAFANVL